MPRANEEAARLLREYADLLSIAGEDRFRIRAYENAARSIAGTTKDVAGLSVKELTKLPGVGKAIAEKVREYADTDTIAKLDELRARVGGGVRDLLEVGGLGPKRAAFLHSELGISTVDELRAAAERGALRNLPGFGRTLEEKILRATEHAGGERRVHVGTALALAEAVIDELRDLPEAAEIAYAGSLRRVMETIGDVDVLVASEVPAPVMERFCTMGLCREVLAHGETKSSVMTVDGVQVDLRVVQPDVWGAALVYFTGSKAHNIKIRERAVKRGLKLSEYGLFRVEEDGTEGELVVSRTEEEVYAALDLPWIPPTLREDRGEVEAAARGELPDVVALDDIKGDLHGHTNLTDGVATLEEMVDAAAARGYRYYAVTDHAPLLSMQRMTPEKALAQRAAVAKLQDRVGKKMAILHGSELNIQEDGSVDWPEDFLSGFDVLVASIHSHFDLPREAQTRRLVRAMENPCVNVIGHPSARRYGKRPSIELDVDEVCKVAARTGTALEVNGQPERLDLPDELVRAARDHGVKLAVSTDAHSIRELDNMRLGVATAQRGWAEKGDVVNVLGLRDLRRFLQKGRRA